VLVPMQTVVEHWSCPNRLGSIKRRSLH
jgi:hypothetical protein